jgi:transposase
VVGAKEKQANQACGDGHVESVRKATLKPEHAPGAAILFDKFHVLRHLSDALDQVRKSEYGRLVGKDRRFIKGQKYTLLSHRDNLTTEGRRSVRLLLKATTQCDYQKANHLNVLGQQEAQYRLRAQGNVWTALGLSDRGLGPTVLSRTGAIH